MRVHQHCFGMEEGRRADEHPTSQTVQHPDMIHKALLPKFIIRAVNPVQARFAGEQKIDPNSALCGGEEAFLQPAVGEEETRHHDHLGRVVHQLANPSQHPFLPAGLVNPRW